MTKSLKSIAIILAAGQSTRAKTNKLWAKLNGRPLWTLSYETFVNHPEIQEVVLVVPAGEEEKFRPYLREDTAVVSGGSTRMESLKKGLAGQVGDVILDHNAANPHVSSEEISAVIAAALEHGAAALSHPVVDTVMREENGFYVEALDRDELRLMQTPQAMRADIWGELKEATDLTSALLGKTKVKLVEANPRNRKVTFAEDLLGACSTFGEDSHRFSTEGTLRLAGIDIDGLPKLEANSDGDVILHAIGRALAQATGKDFSDVADELCKQGVTDSAAYIQALLKGVELERVAIQLECQKPRINDLNLVDSLANVLNISSEKIHVSAMSGEGLTAFGRGEGIRCLALITLL